MVPLAVAQIYEIFGHEHFLLLQLCEQERTEVWICDDGAFPTMLIPLLSCVRISECQPVVGNTEM